MLELSSTERHLAYRVLHPSSKAQGEALWVSRRLTVQHSSLAAHQVGGIYPQPCFALTQRRRVSLVYATRPL